VLGVFAIGVLIAGFGSWRYGAVVMAAATLLAGIARMLLPRRVSGLLVVRRRWMDITILFSLGTAIGVLALVVPPGT
jgi:hypothetical protein